MPHRISGAHAYVIVDIGYGDSGKGTMVDYLAAATESDLVVRFNGGAQGGHNVVTPGGRWHTFSQIGSASFLAGVRTHLSRHVVVHPFALRAEVEHLRSLGVRNLWKRLTIDGRAIVTTPFHQAWNRLREQARGDHRHGSCGAGFGETMRESIEFPQGVIRVSDLGDASWVERSIKLTRERVLQWVDEETEPWMFGPHNPDLELVRAEPLIEAVVRGFQEFAKLIQTTTPDETARLIHSSRSPIFEGSQSVLLDMEHGFPPHTTYSKTDFTNADAILESIGWHRPVIHVGVTRTHMARHGPGPLVTEDLKLSRIIREPHNQTGPWQGPMRYGHLDLVALRHSVEACGRLSDIAVTHTDFLRNFEMIRVATAWRTSSGERWAPSTRNSVLTGRMTPRTEAAMDSFPEYVEVPRRELIDFVEAELDVPIKWLSFGRTRLDKERRRPRL